MAVKVRCRNQNCPMFNQECEMIAVLDMAPDEKIYCGGCGNEARWVGAERPTRNRPWQAGMNNVVPFIAMDDADA